MKIPEGKQLFWEQNVDGMLAKCYWENSKYIVIVSKGDLKKEAKFNQTFTPTFGMDTADVRQSLELAEKLAVEIETEEKSKKNK